MDNTELALFKMRLAALSNGRKSMIFGYGSNTSFMLSESFKRQLKKENATFLENDVRAFYNSVSKRLDSYYGAFRFIPATGDIMIPTGHVYQIIYSKL